MNKVTINDSRCPKNHPCPVVRFCPTGAINQKDFFSAPVIDQDNCASCGKCVKMCGYGAFQYASNEK